MKLKFIEDNVSQAQINYGNNSDPREILTVGKEYELENAIICSWHTSIVLKEFPNCKFNSVWFTWSETDDVSELIDSD